MTEKLRVFFGWLGRTSISANVGIFLLMAVLCLADRQVLLSAADPSRAERSIWQGSEYMRSTIGVCLALFVLSLTPKFSKRQGLGQMKIGVAESICLVAATLMVWFTPWTLTVVGSVYVLLRQRLFRRFDATSIAQPLRFAMFTGAVVLFAIDISLLWRALVLRYTLVPTGVLKFALSALMISTLAAWYLYWIRLMNPLDE